MRRLDDDGIEQLFKGQPELIRTATLCELLAIDRHALRNWVANEHFPKPLALTKKNFRWPTRRVKAWLKSRDRQPVPA
jgi:predicted DNA-binding transcriptional regulator AlpA